MLVDDNAKKLRCVWIAGNKCRLMAYIKILYCGSLLLTSYEYLPLCTVSTDLLSMAEEAGNVRDARHRGSVEGACASAVLKLTTIQ